MDLEQETDEGWETWAKLVAAREKTRVDDAQLATLAALPFRLVAEVINWTDKLSSLVTLEALQMLRSNPEVADHVANLLTQKIRIERLANSFDRKVGHV